MDVIIINFHMLNKQYMILSKVTQSILTAGM